MRRSLKGKTDQGGDARDRQRLKAERKKRKAE